MARGKQIEQQQAHPQPLPQAGGEPETGGMEPANAELADQTKPAGMEDPKGPNISAGVRTPPEAARIKRTRVRAGTLLAALRDVDGAVAARTEIPILAHVLIAAAANAITLTGTDLDLWVTREVVADVLGQPDSPEWSRGSAPFTLTVAAKPVLALLGELDPDAMVVVDASEPRRVEFRAGRAKFRLPTLPPEDFPAAAAVCGAGLVQFELPASALADHLARVDHAISTEEARYYLNGVFVHVHQDAGEPSSLRFAATDGHRLARLAAAVPEGAESWPDTIIPRRAVALLGKLLGHAIKTNEQATVDMACADAKLRFDLPAADDGTVTLTTKTIDGSFPDYARVIPSDPPLRAVLDRLSLAAAVKRVATIVSEKTRLLAFDFATDRLTIRGSSAEFGTAEDELACDFAGELTIGLDAAYLRAALLAVATDEVVLRMSDAMGPVRIEARASDGEELALVQVLMPVRV